MARTEIETLQRTLDEAFDGPFFHGLMTNLKSVTDDDWEWVAPGGRRHIREIVEHTGAALYVYESHGFGDASINYGANIPPPASDGREDAMAWLRAGHARLRGSIAALDDDAALALVRKAHWGAEMPVRWFIGTMIQHLLYHAGEINHIRALHQGNDE